jgi:FG-GAP-like repeat
VGRHRRHGLPDLAMGREANADGPGLQIYQNSGIANGKFQLTAVTIAGDPIDTIRMVWWRDFDADGDLDLLASGKGIYLVVTQNGTFTSHRLTATNADVNATWLNTTSAPPWRIAAANEMAMDVVTYTISEAFALSSPTSLGFGEGAITWCNVGGTPARDVIVGNRIFIANATGFAAPSNASGAGYLPSCVDLDDDNDNDLVLGDYSTVRIIINNGGLATPPIEFPIIFPDYFGIADFDDDGRIDILVSSAEASDNVKQIPLRMIENRTTGFEVRQILPDWNAPELDSRGLDIAYVPDE